MRWSTTLTWLVLPYLYPYHSVILANAQGNIPPSYSVGSKAQPGKPGQPKASAGGGDPAPQLKDVATELLLLKPLSDGKVATHIEFEYLNRNGVPRDPQTLGVEDKAQHYEFFPLSMGQILREYAVAELHLTLNTGRWRYDTWGFPENPAVASGAELWVWMANGGPVSMEDRWRGLTNALAGLFCASLTSLSESRTTSPHHSFYPEGQLPLYSTPSNTGNETNPAATGYTLHHAILPSEAICTENLTPFIKLLPCKSYAGVAELLNPHQLFSGWWYGMGVHATWHDGETNTQYSSVEEQIDPRELGMSSKARPGKYKEDEKYSKEAGRDMAPSQLLPTKEPRGVKLKLTVGSVRDPIESQQTGKLEERRWNLEGLFGRNVTKLCPVTSKADARILPLTSLAPFQSKKAKSKENSPSLMVEPQPLSRYRSRAPGFDGENIWDIVRVSGRGLNLTVTQKNALSVAEQTNSLTPLTITRSLRGSDQTRGGLSISITNHINSEVEAWYVESVPWIIRPYLSTLHVESIEPLPNAPGSNIDSNQRNFIAPSNFTRALNLKNIHYVPPSSSKGQNSRTKPTLLEMPLRLPSRSTVRISFEFEKVFLKYTEHPPDAQRGWEIPGGILVPTSTASEVGGNEMTAGRLPRMYTAPLLADLATPDFSMPYNVIILSGALVALSFGMLFNMLVRRYVLVKT